MPTTTKMGIVYPSSTDLVKDGATAMGTISTTVDAKTGLVLIKSTAFSAQSTVSVSDVFDTNYENYKIIVSCLGSSTNALTFRLRVSGADNSTSNYYYGGVNVDSSAAAVSLIKGDPLTSWRIGATGTDFNLCDVTIAAPFTTDKTSFVATSSTGFGTNEAGSYNISGFFSGTTSFTGFTLIPAAGTITGNVRVYGINQ